MRWLLILVVVLAACGSQGGSGAPETTAPTAPPATITTTVTTGDECAHVRAVVVTGEGDGRFRFDVTVASTETGWDKYADAWEVRAPDGTVLGERVLAHPHETEQPFTRSLGGVEIASNVGEVTIAAHDLVLGFCGDVMTVAVPHDS